MLRIIRLGAGLLARVLVVVVLAGSGTATALELWALGKSVTGINNDAIARFNDADGAFNGYFMHPTSGAYTTPDPLYDMTIGGPEGKAYLAYGSKPYYVASYDFSGGVLDPSFVTGPGGTWYKKQYLYTTPAIGCTDDYFYYAGGIWSTNANPAGSYLFRHNYDGTPAGTQAPERGAQFQDDPFFSGITGTRAGVETDSAGNSYVTTGPAVFRFAPDGQWFGPGGLGDTTAWLDGDDLVGGSWGGGGAGISDIEIDAQDRLYITGHNGGVVAGHIWRYLADGTPAGIAPGSNVFADWGGYGGLGPIYPNAPIVGPDGYLYIASNYLTSTRTENMILRYYTDGPDAGSLVEVGGFANFGGEDAPLVGISRLMFTLPELDDAVLPEPGSAVLLVLAACALAARPRRT